MSARCKNGHDVSGIEIDLGASHSGSDEGGAFLNLAIASEDDVDGSQNNKGAKTNYHRNERERQTIKECERQVVEDTSDVGEQRVIHSIYF